MAKLRPPIPWVGGKATKVHRLLPHICEHQIYVEPFGGAAALLFAKEPSPVEIYNDIDHGLVDFFRLLQNPSKFREFKRKIEATPYSREEYNFCNTTWRELKRSSVERVRRWFVVARQSYAGHFGASWGYAKTLSTHNMSAVCWRWLLIIERLPEIHKRLMRVQIEHLDFTKVLDKYDSKDTFFYLDPPYVPKSRRMKKIYEHELTEEAHIGLIEKLADLQGKVMLTGFPSELYNKLDDDDWFREDFQHQVSTAGRTSQGKKAKIIEKGGMLQTECIWLSPNLVEALKKEGKEVGYRDKMKQRQETVSKRMQSGNFMRLQEGRNILRLFPFKHKVTEADFERGVYEKNEEELGKKVEELDCYCPVHFTAEGPVNCSLGDCEICERSKELSHGDKDDQKAGRALRASKRYGINAVDVTAKEKKIAVYQVPQSVYLGILSFINDPDYEDDELTGCEGRDFVIKYDKSKTASEMYSVMLRDKDKCKELDEDEIGEVKDLLDMDALKPGHSGRDNAKESDRPEKKSKKKKDDEDKDEGEKKKSSGARKKGGARKKSEEDKDDKDDDALKKPKKFKKGAPVRFKDDKDEWAKGKVKKGPYDDEDDDGKVYEDCYDVIDVFGEKWTTEYKDMEPLDEDALPFQDD